MKPTASIDAGPSWLPQSVPTGDDLTDPAAIRRGMVFDSATGDRVTLLVRRHPDAGGEDREAFSWATDAELSPVNLKAMFGSRPAWRFAGCNPNVASAQDLAFYGPPRVATDEDLERLFEAADNHTRESEEPWSEDGVTHAVGDLQGVLRTAWKMLSPAQRTALLAEHQELLDEWAPTGKVALTHDGAPDADCDEAP